MNHNYPRVKHIEINFPEQVELLPGSLTSIVQVIEDICQHYNATHSNRGMWHSGGGFKPIWKDGDICDFCEDIFEVNVSCKHKLEE